MQAVIWLDGVSPQMSRSSALPNIHLELLFSPAMLFARLPAEQMRRCRWVVLDPLNRATDEERALTRLLAPRLAWLGAAEPELLSRLMDPVPETAWSPWQAHAALEFARMLVTRSGTRHAVANVLGALWLCSAIRPGTPSQQAGLGAGPGGDAGGDVGGDAGGDVIARLDRLLRQLRLLPAPGEAERFVTPGAWFGSKEWKGLVDRFVVLDDLCGVGWSAFLRLALGISSEDSLRASDNPDRDGFGPARDKSLLDLLLDAKGTLCVGRGESLTGGKDEIFFIDLRLFQNRSVAAERRFLARLLEAARQAPASRADLPWPGFTDDELSAADR